MSISAKIIKDSITLVLLLIYIALILPSLFEFNSLQKFQKCWVICSLFFFGMAIVRLMFDKPKL